MRLYRILLVLVVTSALVQARRRNRKKNRHSIPGPNIGNHPTHPPNELPSNGDPVNIANQRCEKRNPVSAPVCSPIFFPPQNGDLHITLVARIECNNGYDLLPNAQREYDCESSGGRYDWDNDTMSCCLIDCNDPPAVTNGNRDYDCTVQTCDVTYTCNSGYFLDGVSSRTCQANGQWSGDSPTCPPVDCLDIDAPDNGQIVLPCTTYTCTANFSCNAGYELNGFDHRTCQASGVWSHSQPTCEPVDCLDIDAPDNGQIILPCTTYTCTANFSCNAGYELNGFDHRTCQASGVWSHSQPTCEPVDCLDLADPDNGDAVYTCTTYTCTANFTCNDGFERVGSDYRTCGANGDWTFDNPTCVACTTTTGRQYGGSPSFSTYTLTEWPSLTSMGAVRANFYSSNAYTINWHFKTTSANGIFLFAGPPPLGTLGLAASDSKDFIGARLDGGVFIHSMDNSNGHGTASVGSGLNDGQWHSAIIIKDSDAVTACVDGVCQSGMGGTTNSGFADILPMFYIGGVPSDKEHIAVRELGMSRGFKGCIVGLTVNSNSSPDPSSETGVGTCLTCAASLVAD